jgi:serine/threonine-protein kinase RIO1
MKRIWTLENCFIKSVNNEALVYNSIKKNNFSIKEFKFSYILFQSNDEYFDGIKQWSRRNRRWIYNGIEYIRGHDI